MLIPYLIAIDDGIQNREKFSYAFRDNRKRVSDRKIAP